MYFAIITASSAEIMPPILRKRKLFAAICAEKKAVIAAPSALREPLVIR
jgi:hypothetical protein